MTENARTTTPTTVVRPLVIFLVIKLSGCCSGQRDCQETCFRSSDA